MALFQHGLRRFTEVVDILVRKEDLKLIHEKLEGHGYVPPFRRSKQLRDVENGVRIEFLATGDFPGDGKPKPVAFPESSTVCFEAEGIRYIHLPKLVELKLASGMTNPGRLRDLSDVLDLIKVLDLPASCADRLDMSVRDKYREFWQQARKRFVMVWRDKNLTADVKSIDDLIAALPADADQLDQMRDGQHHTRRGWRRQRSGPTGDERPEYRRKIRLRGGVGILGCRRGDAFTVGVEL